MGIEQNTPLRVDLARHADLVDLRLPRAFKAWTNLKIYTVRKFQISKH